MHSNLDIKESDDTRQKFSHKQYPQRGFTLIEAVIVIIISGIIAAVVAVFIRLPVQGYLDSAARAELTDMADTALRRMERDLRLALPNSIRTDATGTYIELLLTKTGGRFLGEDETTGGSPIPLSFSSTGSTSFYVIGQMPAAPRDITTADYIVIYNLGSDTGSNPANAYDCSGSCNRTGIASVGSTTTNRVDMTSNPFALQTPEMKSSARHFQIVTGPVTYACIGTTLIRYSGYSIQEPTQLTSDAALVAAGAQKAMLANGVTGCVFTYTANIKNSGKGLVGLQITMQNPNTANSGSVSLFHQVHVDNTP